MYILVCIALILLGLTALFDPVCRRRIAEKTKLSAAPVIIGVVLVISGALPLCLVAFNWIILPLV